LIGKRLPRKEDDALLRGRACFVDDFALSDLVHATILRSPHAHARVVSIDASRARADASVVAVVSADDLPEGGPEIPMRMFVYPGTERFLQRPLAHGVVRYSGEPVAVLVAESRYSAEDAAELVEVVYEPLEAVVEAHRGLDDGAPVVHAAAGSNLAGSFTIDKGDVDAAFASADVVVEERIVCGRHAAVPLETRGLAAEVDPRTGELTVWGAAKIPHVNRRMLAGMLRWPEERIRLVELHVGGGFGGRGEFYPEDYLIPYCAVALGRPVAWVEDREEHLRSSNHSREQIHEIGIALGSDGSFLALRDRLVNDQGAYIRTHGMVVPGMSAGLLPGPYHWPAYRCDVAQAITNKTPAGTYRAPGRFEANLARERLIDIAARRLDRDPADLRRQNLVPPERIPYETGTHTAGHPVVYESNDFPLLLDKALARFDYDAMRAWRDSDSVFPRRRGLGLAFFVEKSGIGGWEYARVELVTGGKTVVYTGTASVGQGVETALAQICADVLGVRYEDVTVRHGDTADVPDGMGAFGSRATMLAGSAVSEASTALRERVLRLAGFLLEADASDLAVAGDRVVVRGSESRGTTLAELVEAARAPAALAAGLEPGLAEARYFRCDDMSFPYGLHCAAVEVDVETGAVAVERYLVAYDIGRAINPTLVEGQIAGGAAQGLGGALFEELAYDPGGQLVAGSFMDYLLPTACEVPDVEVLVTEDAPTPLNPLGAKGAGEGGAAAVGAAIANAVSDALDAEATRLPLSPERVLELARADAP
jgi:CO/xanthine dehydrogenase Mo-binding subunit